MYTGGPRDRNTHQCRKTTQQFFLCLFCMGYVSHVHGRTQQILLVCFLHGLYLTHTRETPTNVSCVFSAWVTPNIFTGRPHDRNTRQCRKTTQQTFLVFFLHGLYLTCTREDPTTVTPASVAKHNKTFLCLFCMGYNFTCTREDPATVTPASVAKHYDKSFLCIFCMGYT